MVFVVRVHIVPLFDPHAHVMVCVNDDDALLIVKALAVPSVPFPAVSVLLRGIVSSVTAPLAVILD